MAEQDKLLRFNVFTDKQLVDASEKKTEDRERQAEESSQAEGKMVEFFKGDSFVELERGPAFTFNKNEWDGEAMVRGQPPARPGRWPMHTHNHTP